MGGGSGIAPGADDSPVRLGLFGRGGRRLGAFAGDVAVILGGVAGGAFLTGLVARLAVEAVQYGWNWGPL